MNNILKSFKSCLTFFPDFELVRLLAYSPKIRSWKKAWVTEDSKYFETREKLYQFLVDEHCSESFLFLEFGCAAGNVVRYWANYAQSPNARFIGFDTFTGMPEPWFTLRGTVKPGTWSLDGVIPESEDKRVSYEKGVFQESLPKFLSNNNLVQSSSQLIVHIDADLYSSTLFVLCSLTSWLDNAIVLFDEFDCALDEFRALEDYCNAYKKQYKVLATTPWCEKIAIQFV